MIRPLAAPPRIAVAYLAFDRHHLVRLTLGRVLRHLPAGWPLKVWLDGEREPHSGRLIGDPRRIARNLDHLQAHALEIDHQPGHNRGTALTYWSAERWAFETLGADALVMIEDDIVISPHFFTMAARLARLALAEPHIGAFSPFGRSDLPRVVQALFHRRLLPMHHRWGYGITRRYWEASRPHYADYLALLAGRDDRDRPHQAITDWIEGLVPGTAGVSRITGQDGARTAIMLKLGCFSVMTTPSYALNVGKQGMHFHPRFFHQHRPQMKGRYPFFPTAVTLPGTLRAPTRARLAKSSWTFQYW